MFVLLLAIVAITAPGVSSDDIQKVKVIVEGANNFLKDHHVTVLRLPNIGVLSTDPIKMREGTLEGLDTMEVLQDPMIHKKKNKDGSTTYLFFVNFGLKNLSFHYDFESTAPVVSKGELWIIPEGNALEAAGIVVLGDDVCDARLYSVMVEKLGKFTIDTIPVGSAKLINAIAEFTTQKIEEATEAAFEGETLDPVFQAWFSDFVCYYLKPKKLLDFIQNY